MSAKDFKASFFSFEAGIFLTVLGALFAGWVGLGPSNQELLANYAKARDLWDLIVVNKGFAWWSPNYLGDALPCFNPKFPNPNFFTSLKYTNCILEDNLLICKYELEAAG